jgi:hypothetical protein
MKVYVVKSTTFASVEANSEAEALDKVRKGEVMYIQSENTEIIGKLEVEVKHVPLNFN